MPSDYETSNAPNVMPKKDTTRLVFGHDLCDYDEDEASSIPISCEKGNREKKINIKPPWKLSKQKREVTMRKTKASRQLFSYMRGESINGGSFTA